MAGQSRINFESSVWKDAVVRGDVEVGHNTTICEGAVVTNTFTKKTVEGYPRTTKIGNYTVVGENAVVISSHIDDEVMVGNNAIVNEGCYINTHSILAADAVLEPHTTVPSGEMWAGNPAQKVRNLDDMELLSFSNVAEAFDVKRNDHVFAQTIDTAGTVFAPFTTVDTKKVYDLWMKHAVPHKFTRPTRTIKGKTQPNDGPYSI